MATTLVITNKTSTSVDLMMTKTIANTVYTVVGPGSTWEDIYNNKVGEVATSGGAGSYPVNFTTGLSANTQYGGVAFAIGGGESEISAVVDATLPPPQCVGMSVGGISTSAATVYFTTQTDGGYYQKTLEYSIDDGATWLVGDTIATGQSYSGTFGLNGLSPGTEYNLKTRLVTIAGATNNPDITFVTPFALYGSVDNKTTGIKKIYGSVNGLTKEITKLYASVGGVTKRIF